MISTRLTDFFKIDHPVISAPMAFAAGGRLAAAVTKAGGLGLIGGSYGDADWIEQQFREAGNTRVGCGLITWALSRPDDKRHVFEKVVAHKPQAVFLSFGDPAPYIPHCMDAGIPVICQVQNMEHAAHAIDSGASVIVAQGAEAGGHGESRATLTLVPEVANLIAKKAPDTILCAAGGVGDGRGLAAALMLGADGALVGSRFWASNEALVHPKMLEAALSSNGDGTIQSSVMDIARRLQWPERYGARVLKNEFTERWHNDLPGLLADQDDQADQWRAAWAEGNTTIANTFVGEVAGLIDSVRPAADILTDMVNEARVCLDRY